MLSLEAMLSLVALRSLWRFGCDETLLRLTLPLVRKGEQYLALSAFSDCAKCDEKDAAANSKMPTIACRPRFLGLFEMQSLLMKYGHL